MSDDDIDTGPIVSGPASPGPSEPGPAVVHVPDVESRQEQVKDSFAAGLALTAMGTEDATDFVREREAQKKFLAGEDLSPAQMKEWHERTHEALRRAADAQARARGEVPPSQQQAAQPLPGYVEPDAPDYDVHMAAAQERFSAYFDDPNRIGNQNTAAEHKAAVTAWLTTQDPRSELAGYYMASPLGPQIADALAAEPEVIPYLLSLPRPQQAHQMAKLEGFLAARMQQQQNVAPPEPQPRTVSKAPPPIRSPRGGANPPKDLHSLAMRDNVKDYVETRRKQEHDAWQERQLERWGQ